jgi:alcohol dehydrogenase
VIRVPETISDELAILAILTCDMAKGVRKLRPLPEEQALVTGAGAIGLLTLFILKAYGVARVDVVEPLPERRALALRLGAARALAPDELAGEGEDYALACECSSRDAAFALLQRHLKREGRLCVLADGTIEPLTLIPAFHEKELSIVGSSDGWDYPVHAAWYFEELQRHPAPLEQLFDLEIAREQLPQTFAGLADGRIQALKVLVRY